MKRWLAILAAVVLGGCSTVVSGTSPPAAATTPIRIAAASDLRFAMDELIAEWNAANPGGPAEATYGSSGNFLAQIREGAPFDVFFSADAEYPRELERAGLAESGATRLYGIGQIVVWVRAESALDVEARGLEALTEPSVRTLAIANPEHAPYGRAAVAALESAGLYDALQPRFVLGENISQAAQFVDTGSADVGIIALSLALAPALAGGRYAIIPIDSYPRLEQGAVVLNAAADPAAARAFVDFVLGPAGRIVLDRFGFLRPSS